MLLSPDSPQFRPVFSVRTIGSPSWRPPPLSHVTQGGTLRLFSLPSYICSDPRDAQKASRSLAIRESLYLSEVRTCLLLSPSFARGHDWLSVFSLSYCVFFFPSFFFSLFFFSGSFFQSTRKFFFLPLPLPDRTTNPSISLPPPPPPLFFYEQKRLLFDSVPL